MHMPVFTLACAGLLGLIFAVLSVLVVLERGNYKVMIGDGDAAPLQVSIRSQANFAEYVPLCLLLIAGLEVRTGATLLVKALGILLVLARLAHPGGMALAAPNPLRSGGFAGTWLVLLIASLALLVQAF